MSVITGELLNFDEIERSRYENMSFAKRIVLCSFTEILFQRKLLPRDAFKAIRLKGVNLIVLDADHDDAYENLVKLSKICDDIENEAVKTLRFIVNFIENGEEKVGEVFEIYFFYGDNITLSLKLGDSVEHFRYDGRTLKKDFQVFIMRLRHFCRMLRDLPEGSYGRYHIVYNDGKRMQESGCDYFCKVIRAPLKWTGPKQEICGIVGVLNRQEIGLKMSVGTLFGTGSTDSMALAENLKEENWDCDYEERYADQLCLEKTTHASYCNEIVQEGYTLETDRKKEQLIDGTGAKVSVVSKRKCKLRRSEESEGKMKRKIDSRDDVLKFGRIACSDSAHRGSDIDMGAVLEMDEEGIEKEGRMEARRKRRMIMMERKNTTVGDDRNDSKLVRGGCTELSLESGRDGKSTTTS
ncbi:hypothetical protein PRIPAC_82792, partial [Pristionchus pacificus]